MSERYQDDHKVQGIGFACSSQVWTDKCLIEWIREQEDGDCQRYESPIEYLTASAGHLSDDETTLYRFKE